MKASTNLKLYVQGDDWFEFGWVDRLTLTGGGTFDGQGAVSWPYNKCPKNKNCKVLPTVSWLRNSIDHQNSLYRKIA